MSSIKNLKILGLYNNDCAVDLFEWLQEQGHEVILCTDRLDVAWCKEQHFDLAVSYTYRYILSSEHLEALNNNVINLHNSLLPWNRGADPNLWSIVENTPRGVTLHYMDAGLDKGYVIAQDIVPSIVSVLANEKAETLKTTYDSLDMAAKSLFKKAFAYYNFWPSLKKQCLGKGSYHSLQDGKRIKSVISTYNISVVEYRNRLKNVTPPPSPNRQQRSNKRKNNTLLSSTVFSADFRAFMEVVA